MALVIADRVRETSTTTGTGTLTLGGAVSGFQTFSAAIGNTNTCYYTIVNGSEWEIGIGTVAAGSLARTTILESSNADAIVNFSAGTKDVFVTYPADYAVTTPNTNTFTANQIVSVTDNTNAALRITQLGTGNALLVEDSTNPDASPFVIDGLGKINIGSLVQYAMTPTTPYTQWNNADNQYASVGLTSWQAGTNTQSKLIFGRGDSNIVGDFSNAVDSGDNLGSVHWTGSDGVGFIESASISASVDGTPGTNDMPGRLVFSTTADGASTPTERMRINSAGNVGIGSGISQGDTVFTVSKNMTGATTSYGIRNISTVQSDSTISANSFQSAINTAASAFTVANLRHFQASQGTIGATSAVTTQYGFTAESSLTGATNNYGFYGNIASGTGRYNLYMNGTAANYLGGQLQLGQDYIEKTNTANTSTAYTIDLANGSVQILTLTGNCTFTFPTVVSGKGFTLLLLQDATGSRTVTWPASVKWPASTAPTITATASKMDKYVFVANGSYWIGSNAGQNYL
jgi:hypothetical protein